MIKVNDEIFKQIVSFVNACTGKALPVYNVSMMQMPPKDRSRIEFKLTNFVSTGQIYREKIIGDGEYIVKSTSEYRCQLMFRIFANAVDCGALAERISGGIQTFDFLDNYINLMSVKNETMRISPFIIQKDDHITDFQEILVDCYIGIEFEGEIPYFDTLEDTDFIYEN